MNNVFAVSSSETVEHLPNDVDRVIDLQFPSLREQLAQVSALYIFHSDEFEALDLAQVVNSHDVAMGHLAGQKNFLLKPLEDVRVCRQFGTDDLQGDETIQGAISGFVYGTHASLTEHLENFVTHGHQHAGRESELRRIGLRAAGRCGSARSSPLVRWAQVNKGRRI